MDKEDWPKYCPKPFYEWYAAQPEAEKFEPWGWECKLAHRAWDACAKEKDKRIAELLMKLSEAEDLYLLKEKQDRIKKLEEQIKEPPPHIHYEVIGNIDNQETYIGKLEKQAEEDINRIQELEEENYRLREEALGRFIQS